MMWESVALCFASNHPSAEGHFPSNPIIPGALLLDEVVKLIAEMANRGGEIKIRSAKFHCLVRPGESLHVRWQPLAAGTIKFECWLIGQDALAAAGTLEIGSAPS